jgi:hypothetical protein
MADKEISTINDGYPDQERRATIASINMNKNLDAKYDTRLPLGTGHEPLLTIASLQDLQSSC